MKTPRIRIVLAGAALSVGLTGCPKDNELTANPPAPQPIAPPMNPPAPVDVSLPTWDEVPSGHPPGATNPPAPELIVTPDGDCYKRWVGRMRPTPGAVFGNRVQACPEPEACGTAIQCPPEATPLLADWKTEHGVPSE